jgi:hypothetical protein
MPIMNQENSKLKIHKHNDLVKARYGALTLPEQLLLLSVIGKVLLFLKAQSVSKTRYKT